MAANNDTRCAEYSLVLIHLYNVSGREMDVVDPWNCTQARQKLHSIEDNWTAYAELFCLLYIIICTPMLFLQLTSLPIIFAQKNYWKNICYKILFANGVVDSIQLGTILIFAILRLTIGLIDDRIVKLGGAIVIPIWSLVVIQHLLLAINRLLVVLRVRYPDSKLIPSENVEKRATKITLLLSWLLFLSVFALFMSPLAGMTFDYAVVIFRFNLLLPHTSTFQTVNWLLTGWMPLVCFCCYAVTVYNVRKIRTDTSQSKLNTSLFNASERRLLIQAIILYTFMTFLIFGWNIVDRCYGTILTGTTCTARIFGHKLFEVSLELHSLLVEAPWMIFCGLSPILLLSMNSEFRQCYLQLYTCRKSQQLDRKIHTSTAVTMDQ